MTYGDNFSAPEQQPGASRRTVLRTAGTAAWATPVIVVATAAPAMAVSGPALVTTSFGPNPPHRGGSSLFVDLSFLNANTQSTGATVVTVGFTPTVGSITTTAPTIGPTSSSGWNFSSTGGTAPETTFTFSRAAGIDGAATPTGTATTILAFSIVYVSVGGSSSGAIRVAIAPTSGAATGNNMLWF